MTFVEKNKKALELIEEFISKYPKIGVALSYGKDSMVLLDLIRMIDPDIYVFAVSSDTEFPETLALRDTVLNKWKLNYKEFTFHNDASKGIEECCRAQKVKTFKKAVKDIDCWFSGIRKDEGFTRTNFDYVEERDGLIKVNPILDFTEKDIWRYTAIHGLPVNKLYGKGYRSLSCSRCSAVELDETENERAGRWVGTKCEGGECGIHTQSLRG